jgi:ribonuclease HI
MSSSSTPGLFPEPASKTPASSTADWLSAHCDGGARGNPGPSGYGAVIQDASGQVLAELSVFLGIKTNNFAEYSGLLGVLEWTLANGHTHLRVVSDSELMVKQIQGKYKVNSPDLRPLWEEARRRIARLARFEISHALRHKNKTADRLANEAMDRGMGKAPGGTGAAKSEPAKPATATPYPKAALRGRIHNGTIQLLDGASLPEGSIVKIIPE